MCYNQIISLRLGKWFMGEPVLPAFSGAVTLMKSGSLSFSATSVAQLQ